MDPRNELFCKLLKELAGQLWQTQLEEALQSEQIRQCFPISEQRRGIRSHEELFETLMASNLISPSDISLLTNVLERQQKTHLLWPLYEAGFGRDGLRRGSTSFHAREGLGACGESASTDLTGETPTDGPRPVQPGLAQRSNANGIVRRGSSGGTQLGRKLCKPANKHGAAHAELKELLRNVGSQIGGEDLSALAFLCQDVISRSQLEQVSSGIDLFRALRKRRCITEKRLEFLYRILRDCGRLDLSHLVDSYVYLNLKQLYQTEQNQTEDPVLMDDPADYSSDSDTLTYGGGRMYQFRTSLKCLGDNLGYSDLQSMKVLAGCFIPESKLEKVKTVFDLFVLVEERGKLSIDDLSFLEELLEDKQHLVNQLYAKGFGQKGKRYLHKGCVSSKQTMSPISTIPVHMLFSSEHPAMNFRRLLKTVGSQLTEHDISQLLFLCPDDLFLAEHDTIESGLDLLVLLEKRQIVSPLNVSFLLRNLEAIGRKDLCIFVTIYKRSIPQCTYRHIPEDHTTINRLSSPIHRLTLKRSLSLDSPESHRRSAEREKAYSSTSPCNPSPLFPHQSDPETEVDSSLEPDHRLQLRNLQEELKAERLKHERERAKLMEEFLRRQVELQDKNTALYEKLLDRDEALRTLSQTTVQKAKQLDDELECQRQMIDNLSVRLLKGQSSHSERRERQLLETRLKQRERLIKQLSQRVSEQEMTIRKMALTMKLQIHMQMDLKSTEV